MSKRAVRHLGCWLVRVTVLACLVSPTRANPQPAPAGPLTLNDAVQAALKNYPAIRERRAGAQAADESVAVARTAYLPRLDFLWQENRATTNNVFGLLLPQGIVPPISGPVLGTKSYESVWGSAAGVLLSWEAVDFGQRKAAVDVARAQSTAARAQSALTQLDVESAAADAFLTVLAADESVRAARANVDRLQVFVNTVRTLVQNQLRPGADQSRAEAELALARNQVSQAVQGAEIARATLADAIGTAGAPVQVTVGSLANVPDTTVEPLNINAHPAVQLGQAGIDIVRARAHALGRAYFPHLTLQSAFAGRSSGAVVPGLPALGSGAWLDVPNWALGATVTFPAFDFFSINARKRVEAQNEIAESAAYSQTVQTLTTQYARAQALVKAAVDVAKNTPAELQAARDAERQARARYQNGLTTVVEVADAQRLLAQAESDDAVARLGVWRALLATAQTHGDLTPFLAKTRQP